MTNSIPTPKTEYRQRLTWCIGLTPNPNYGGHPTQLSIAEAMKKTRSILAAQFGGFTEQYGTSGYYDAEGDYIEDSVVIFTVYAPDGQQLEKDNPVYLSERKRILAAKFALFFQQESVLATQELVFADLIYSPQPRNRSITHAI